MYAHSSSLPRCRFKLPSAVSSRFFRVVKSKAPSTCRAVMIPNRMGPCTAVSRPLKSMGLMLGCDFANLPHLDDGKGQCNRDEHHSERNAVQFAVARQHGL